MDRKRITSDVSVEGHGKKNSEGRRATGLLCFYMRAVYNALTGRVAELVYAYDSESYPVRVGSSSLPAPTMSMTITIGQLREWLYELIVFGIKEARACVFAASFF